MSNDEYQQRHEWERLTVQIKGQPVTGVTSVSYNRIPCHHCMVEVSPEHAKMITENMEISLSNTGDTRYDCNFKVVHVKDCEIYLVKI